MVDWVVVLRVAGVLWGVGVAAIAFVRWRKVPLFVRIAAGLLSAFHFFLFFWAVDHSGLSGARFIAKGWGAAVVGAWQGVGYGALLALVVWRWRRRKKSKAVLQTEVAR